MSSNIATLAVGVTGDVSSLHSAMAGAIQDVDRFEAKTKSADKAGGNFFGGLLGGAAKLGMAATGVGAVADAVGGLTTGILSGNTNFETYNQQFTTLMHSSDAAKGRLADLAKFGANTPFELPEVVQADKVLLAFGLDSEKTASKFGMSGADIRTIAGDVASGTGASFEEMANLLGKFSSGATGDAVQRMAELGIATKEDLAGMGIQFSKSGQMMSPLPEATNKVLLLMKQKYGGMMDAQSGTFAGMVSNLQDWIGQTIRTVSQPIFEKLEGALQGLLGFLGSPQVQSAITGLADLIGNGIGMAVDLAGRAFAFIMPIASNLFNFLAANGPTVLGMIQNGFNALQPAIQMVMSVLGAIGGSVATFFGAVSQGAPILDSLGQLLGNVFGNLQPLIGAALDWIGSTGLPMLGSALGGLITGALDFMAQQALPAIGGALSSIGSGIAGAIDSILAPQVTGGLNQMGGGFFDWIGTEVLPRVGEVFGTVAGAIGEWITGGGLQSLLSNLARWGQALIDWIGPMIPPLLGALAGFLGAAGGWLLDTGLPTLLGLMGQWGGALLNWIGTSVLPFIGEKLGEFGSAIWGWLTGGGLTALIQNMAVWGHGMTDWLTQQAIPWLLGKLGEFGAAIWGWITGGGLASLISNMQTWGHGMTDWLTQQAIPWLLGKLGEFGAAIWGWITGGGLASLIQNMEQWGHGMTDWLTQQAIPWVLTKLGEFGQTIWGWIVGAAQTANQKAAEMGASLINGLIDAIKAGAQNVINAITGVAGGAIDAAKNFLGIHSPSQETGSIGDQMIAGWVNSIQAGAGLIQQAISQLSALVLATLQTGLPPVVTLWQSAWQAMAAVIGGGGQQQGGGAGPASFLGQITTALTNALTTLFAGAMQGPLNTAVLAPWQAFWMGAQSSPMLQAVSSASNGEAFIQKLISMMNMFLDNWYFQFIEPRLNAIITRWMGWWSSLADTMQGPAENVGIKIADAIALGISSKIDEIAAAGAAAATAAINAAKQAAGVASPSTEGVFIGQMIGAGLIRGMGLMEGGAAGAGAGLAGAALAGARPLAGRPATSPIMNSPQSITVVVQLPDGTFVELGGEAIRVLDYEAGYTQRATGRLGR